MSNHCCYCGAGHVDLEAHERNCVYNPANERFEDDDEDEMFLTYSCGMMPDGQCSMAGTEECDWECPRSN